MKIVENNLDFIVQLKLEKYANHDRKMLLDVTSEFVDQVEETYGFFKDSIHGFNMVFQRTPDSTNAAFFGREDPRKGKTKIQHRATQSQVKQRNSLEGANRKMAFHTLIAQVYMLRDNKYRNLVSVALGVEKN
ncbi:hypothetical protein [Candidatus Halocynthiibacter alkanivorans]|uniref:hypothetical protein n=1 Tax=Candidatus Halocynthiibacter alkanivorans TaxID=2267619 RepID=UPI000DF3525B|nr:hypothetical protein [Candidatus Halocynthiibacter alkanivorans]